jgi:hypothetical protein
MPQPVRFMIVPYGAKPAQADPMRTLRYPLPEGAITDATAKAIQDKARSPIASMRRATLETLQIA